MKKIMILAVVMLLVAGAMLIPAYSADDEKGPSFLYSNVQAEIVAVDVTKATVAIKIIRDQTGRVYEYRTIFISPETKITKGDVVLQISDLRPGDKITARYADVLGKLKTESIIIKDTQTTGF
ncbi:MAG: hypothetical protein M0R66_09355 [Candidatus Omnitrophica bacterium]|nr:hypothetical protein [Candidatus Omnitrophota bacterium]